MQFSETLLERVRKSKPRIDLGSYEIVSRNLVFGFHTCIASERLLIEAESEHLPGNKFSAKLSEYYWRHLEEEQDEVQILKQDLDAANIPVGDPDRFSMAMIGSQYYMIKHVHPVALLGYLAVQEADPTPLAAVETLERLYGKKLFRFLRMHAIKDQEHKKEILELLDETPEDLQKIVSMSAANVLMHYTEACASWR